jgi:type IV pilus assembly protein PilW
VSQDSTLGAGIPSLRRKRLVAGPAVQDEEVIPGVEDFQVQYGIDTTGDNAANRYVDADNIPGGSLVVAVRIWLLMRADQIDGAFTHNANLVYADQNIAAPGDRFRRILVSKTIDLRNART